MPPLRFARSIALACAACVLAATLLSVAARAGPGETGAPPALVIRDVTVVPMDHEGVLEHRDVWIQGDRITGIDLASSTVPGGALAIDGRGAWLMPGLVDMHVHLNDERDGVLYVANGVTTIRNMWGFPETLEWRKQYASGRKIGPTVYTCGAILDGNPPIWPGSKVIETAEQAEQELLAEKAAGYDFVKVYSRLTRTAYDGILAAAKRHGMRVVGHVPDSVGLGAVLELRGQESIEHLTGYLAAVQRPDSRLAQIADWNERRREGITHIDESKLATIAKQSKDAGVWNCVTLIVGARFAALDHRDSLLALPESKFVPPFSLMMWDPARDFRMKGMKPEDFDALRSVSAFQMRMTRALRDAGARILLGTDTSNPFVVAGFSAHEELELLVAAGLTPYEALRTGTADAAEFLHAEGELGEVRPGLRADLVLVDANPLVDVRAAARIRGVVLRGQWMPADDLRSDLASLAKAMAPSSGK